MVDSNRSRAVGETQPTEHDCDARRNAIERRLYEQAQAVGRALAEPLGLDPDDAAQEAALVLADCARRMHRATWPSLRRAIVSRLMRDEGRRRRREPSQDDDEGGWRGCPSGKRIKSAGGALLDRAWMFADLRCPRCGSRGHWETWSAALDVRGCADEEAEAAREAATWTGRTRAGIVVPLRKPRMGDVWMCGRCRSWTYEPRARPQTTAPDGLDCYPRETHQFTPPMERGTDPPEPAHDPTEQIERMIDGRNSPQAPPGASAANADR